MAAVQDLCYRPVQQPLHINFPLTPTRTVDTTCRSPRCSVERERGRWPIIARFRRGDPLRARAQMILMPQSRKYTYFIPAGRGLRTLTAKLRPLALEVASLGPVKSKRFRSLPSLQQPLSSPYSRPVFTVRFFLLIADLLNTSLLLPLHNNEPQLNHVSSVAQPLRVALIPPSTDPTSLSALSSLILPVHTGTLLSFLSLRSCRPSSA